MKQRVLSFDGGSLRRLTVDAAGPLRWVAPERDGGSLLVGDRGTIISYRDGVFRHLKSPTRENLRCVAVSPRDGSAHVCGNSGTVLRVDGGSVSALPLRVRGNLRRLAWDPGGEDLLLVGNSGAAYSLRSEVLRRLNGADTHLRSISWHPRGGTALITGNCFRDSIGGLTPSPNLFEYTGDALRDVATIEESRSDLTSSSWRPDGSDCLLAGFDQTWHSPTLLTYSAGVTRGIRWDASNTLPTACSWKPDGSYALVGTSAMTANEGPSALFRYDRSGVSRVEDLKGFGVSCISWSEETALIACSRRNRAFTS